MPPNERPASAPPHELWSRLDPGVPLALLPVRLETRYGTRTATAHDGTELVLPVLRVRIYPDELSITRGRTGLTASERVAGQQFWGTFDTGSEDEPVEHDVPGSVEHRRQAAYEVLTRRVGAGRADAVARACAPSAPPPPTRTADAPTARLLPSHWVIEGTLHGRQVFARVIERRGPDPRTGPADHTKLFDPEDPLLVAPDHELRWLTDFDAAVEVGMAAVIDLATMDEVSAGALPAVVTDGLDTLVVVGAPDEADPHDHANRVARLLTDHIDTGRAAFVPQATPTNNLTDTASGWSSRGQILSGYQRLVDPPVPRPDSDPTTPILRGGGTDGAAIEAAFGLPAATVARMSGSDGREQWLARNMALALFPVTIGEVVATLTRRSHGGDTEHALDILDSVLPFARAHVADFVRGRGPLPALRIGRQPYGVLPVTLTRDWVRAADEPVHLDRLADILGVLRPCWERAARHVPAIDTDSADSPILARILGHGPLPHPGGYRVRGSYGPTASSCRRINAVAPVSDDGQKSPFRLAAVAATQEWATRRAQLLGYRHLLALTLDGLLDQSGLEHMSLEPDLPMRVPVAATDRTRAGWETPAHYLRRLTTDPRGGDKPKDLLFILVEHALALAGELDATLMLGKIAPNEFASLIKVSPEILGSTLSAGTKAAATLTTPLNRLTGHTLDGLLAGAHLRDIVVSPALLRATAQALQLDDTHVNAYAGTRAAVRALADADATDEEYTALTGETLACAATRLDAWLTSLATQRLATLRTEAPTGLIAGCWGVLVDVRPSRAVPLTDPTRIPPQWPNVAITDPVPGWTDHIGEPGRPLVAPDRHVGCAHAPSLAQARTAGVLRAGELAHQGDGTSVSSLDLTSRRVRAAREIWQAMSHGQPLGALLGYRLERALGDRGMHTHITDLRAAYPQRRDHGAPGEPAGSDSVVPAEVVDGYEVLRFRDRAAAICASTENSAFTAILDDLAMILDAVSDVAVAEGVHTVTNGRWDAAGALFTAVGQATQPPELTVHQQPRAGIGLTNRLVLALDAAVEIAGWNRSAPRARLAPAVERWAETILGPATEWTIHVGERTLGLDTVGVCALDVLVESRTDDTGLRTLDTRLGLGTAEPDPAYRALLALAGAAFDVLAAARPVQRTDVCAPETTDTFDTVALAPPSRPSIEELRATVEVLATELARLQRITDATAGGQFGPQEPLPDELRADLTELAALGLLGAATPLTEPQRFGDTAAYRAAAATALRDVDTLLRTTAPDFPSGTARADRLRELGADGDLATLVAVTRRLGGSAVVPTPELSVTVHTGRVTTTEDDLDTWLTRMGRVRPALAHYEDLRLFTEARGTAPPPLHVAQLPEVESDSWLGGPLPEHGGINALRRWRRPDQPRTHLVVAAAPDVLTRPTLRGLVIDEVVETLPAETVTTGLAVHYDAPNTRPPQTILLAVPAERGRQWTWQQLIALVHETVALSRLRGVELDDLTDTGIDEFLPLTYVRDGVPDTTPLEELTAQRLLLPLLPLGPLMKANRILAQEI